MDLNLIQDSPDWNVGDTRQATEKDLDRFYLNDQYDSYSQEYLLDGMIWKIATKIVNSDRTTEYTLVCTGVQGE